MAHDRDLSLDSALRKVERHALFVQQSSGEQKQLWNIIGKFEHRRVPTHQLEDSIRSLCRLAWSDCALWDVTAALILATVKHYRHVPLKQKVAWIDELSRAGRHSDVRDALAWLARQGCYVDSKIVLQWVSAAMNFCVDQKQAALMLLVGDGRYGKHTALPTSLLLDFLERTYIHYDGNHAVFRFIGLLTLRMRYMSSKASLYPASIKALGEALYAVWKDDEATCVSLFAKWVKRLHRDTAAGVGKVFVHCAEEQIAELQRARSQAKELCGPATM